jgi:PAS domain S-box-containing protein
MVKNINYRRTALLLLMVLGGIAAIWWTVVKTDRGMRSTLLTQARISAHALDTTILSSLMDTKKEYDSGDDHNIKEQLIRMHKASNNCSLVYLMGRYPDGRIFFFADSSPGQSKNERSPENNYDEFPDDYFSVFDSGQEIVSGPITHQWGVLVSALVPVINQETGDLVAVLGMDVDAANWSRKIITGAALPFVVILLCTVLVMTLSTREQAIGLLKESEEKFNLLTEQSLMGTHIVKDGKIIYFNAALVTICGYSAEEIRDWNARKIADIIHPDDLPLVMERVKKREADKKGIITSYAFRLVTKSREIKWVEVYSKTVPFGNGPADIVAMIDITQRKEVEEKLQESQSHLRKVLDLVPQHIHARDYDGRFIMANRAVAESYNMTPEEIVGVHHGDVATNDAEVRQLLLDDRKVMDSGHPEYIPQVAHTDFKGRVHWLETRKVPFTHKGGKAVLVSAVDITDRKQLEEQLQQSQKMEAIGTLAGGIAHDFNNILFPIFGYLEMVLVDLADNNPIKGKLERVYTGAKRARDLVQQILAFSRQSDHEHKPVKIQLHVIEALKLMKSSLPSTIEIRLDIDDTCGVIYADSVKIHQIVMNLCANAYHAMEETGGKLTVTLEEVNLEADDIKELPLTSGTYVCLKVADTGMGIEKPVLKRIFEPYFTTKEKGKGTGLGLSVIHGIVKSHGGHITVDSVPERGTAFKVFFPLMEYPGVEGIDEVDGEIKEGHERILLVDDEKLVVDMLKQMLEKIGYQVTGKATSIDALATFKKNPDSFDFVITDMTMPYMTGEQLARKIMEIRPGIPVIVCTGFSEKMSAEKAAAMGINGFLIKPVVMSDLSGMIRKVLDGKQTANT